MASGVALLLLGEQTRLPAPGRRPRLSRLGNQRTIERRGAGESGITEIDRKSVIQHAACAGRRHRPTVSTTTLVESYLDPVESGAQPIRRNTDPNAHWKASFCLGDHEPGAYSHRCVPFLFSTSPRTPRSGSPHRWSAGADRPMLPAWGHDPPIPMHSLKLCLMSASITANLALGSEGTGLAIR
jgi:hypothetical protein